MRISEDKELLKQNIEEWVKLNIGERFEFREHQFETIFDICLNILERTNHTQIIEAPTGSGKSLLNIISAGVLADYYERSSYILVSDLFLWKQYEDFLNKYPTIKRNYGILKGQTGNYVCDKNGQDIRNADCRMAGISWGKLFTPQSAHNLGYACATRCHYIKERKKAIKSRVVIMTYQLYHFMINVVSKWSVADKTSVFKQRDIIFCDECHNIPSIVSSNFEPEIKMSDIYQLRQLHSYHGNIQLGLFDDEQNNEEYNLIYKSLSLSELEDEYEYIFNVLSNEHSSSTTNEDAIKRYHSLLRKFAETVEAIESNLSYKKQVLNQSFTQEDVLMYKSCSWYRNCMCFWNDFYMVTNDIGYDYILKNIEDSRTLKEKIVKFTCVKEDYLVYNFLMKTAENRVLMSATLGGKEAYAENIGTKYIEENFVDDEEEILFKKIPSTFDFEKSPVYFLNRYKMSFVEKENSLRQLKPIIYKICKTQFANERGMIQTGSYANAKLVYDSAPPEIQRRMLLYNNAKEKTQMITIHQMSKNTILIGPTLVEGIDLPGEQCRFIIILKVPYPVIVDDYVKRKIELFPLWYNSTTSNIIIQGIGRGNRFTDDYCTTYILDACFLALYNSTKEQYSEELQKRIQIFT